MTRIIEIDSIKLLSTDDDGTTCWAVTATIADAVLTIPARYHPADLSSPEEYGPALCDSSFELEPETMPPPIDGTQYDQIKYISNLDLNWEVLSY